MGSGAENKVQFFCPGCGKRLAAAAEKAGRMLSCPGCHQAVQVPYPDAPAAPQSSAPFDPFGQAQPKPSPFDPVAPQPQYSGDEYYDDQATGFDPSQQGGFPNIQSESMSDRVVRSRERDASSNDEFFGPEKKGIDMGIVGGIRTLWD